MAGRATWSMNIVRSLGEVSIRCRRAAPLERCGEKRGCRPTMTRALSPHRGSDALVTVTMIGLVVRSPPRISQLTIVTPASSVTPGILAAALAGLGTRVAEPYPASAIPASTMARLSAQGSLSGVVLHVAGARVYSQSLGLRDATSSSANSATFSVETRNYAEEQPASGILDSIHSRNTSFVRVPRGERPLEYGAVQWRSRTGTSDRLGWRIRKKETNQASSALPCIACPDPHSDR